MQHEHLIKLPKECLQHNILLVAPLSLYNQSTGKAVFRFLFLQVSTPSPLHKHNEMLQVEALCSCNAFERTGPFVPKELCSSGFGLVMGLAVQSSASSEAYLIQQFDFTAFHSAAFR